MEQTVYIDLYFLINTSMDFLCFFIACRLLSAKFSLWRCLLASAFGGAYACGSLFLPFGGVWKVVLDLGACAAMSAIAILRKGQLKAFLGFAPVYAASSVLLGGFMTVLFSLFNRMGLWAIFGDGGEKDGISVWLFAFLAIISGVISLLGGRLFKRRSARGRCELEVVMGKKKKRFSCICDSGNFLREPISGKPCIVLDKNAGRELFPRELYDFLTEGSTAVPPEFSLCIRPIPAKSINGERLFYGIAPSRTVICTDKGKGETDAFLILGDIGRSAEEAQALVPTELLQGVP